ncbi:uncharacterized protein LOC116288480 isoform X1 [Actinia tenebrosa]|uniref:Uncharacterized protein LOC116288480 isoform X1 n=1 Tax=Actinia tenebrosa TaxID=6105 RepID=A0A6P8H6L8_ACTTE|nr:uncharacterized protein LOC116288480 isoform X1 [Actinia tenebrosa]
MANNSKSGEWFEPVNGASPTKVDTPRVSNISCLSHGESSPASDTPRSRIRSDDTDFVKLAKEGGHKDLLSPRPAEPSPSPKKAEVKKADWYYQDKVNNNDLPQKPKSKVKETDTEFLKAAKQGGHKDLLAIKEHKPTAEAVKYDKKGGDWYTHDAVNGVDGQPPATPRSRAKQGDSEFLKLAKEGGHKDLLEIKEHEPTKEPAKYNKKGGDWYYQDGVDIKDSLQKRDRATPDSARVRRNYNKLQVKNTDTEYTKTAKRGGHSDLLKTPRNTPSKTPVSYKRSDWFYLEDNKSGQLPERPKTAPRKSRTMESSVLPGDSVDGPSRPRTAYRKSEPIWLGGAGPQVQPSPRKHISRESGLAPYALHN